MLAFANANNAFNTTMPAVRPYLFDFNLNSFLARNDLTLSTGNILSWTHLCSYVMVNGNYPDSSVGGVAQPEMTVRCRVGTAAALAAHTAAVAAAAAAGNAAPAAPAVVPITAVRVAVGGGALYNQDAVDDEYTDGIFSLANDLLTNNKAMYQLTELVAAHQVSPLTDSQMDSYLTSIKGVPSYASLKKVVNYIASVEPSLMTSPNLQARVGTFAWFRYRTNAASGTGYVRRFMDATGCPPGAVGGGRFGVTAQTAALVQAAEASPWDITLADRIPDKIKGIAWIYLKAIGAMGNTPWYQGKRASDNFLPSDHAKISAIALRYTTLDGDVAAIQGAANVAAVDALVAATTLHGA